MKSADQMKSLDQMKSVDEILRIGRCVRTGERTGTAGAAGLMLPPAGRRRRDAARLAARILAALAVLTALLAQPAAGKEFFGGGSDSTTHGANAEISGSSTSSACTAVATRPGAMQHISYKLHTRTFSDNTTRYTINFDMLPRSAANLYDPSLDSTPVAEDTVGANHMTGNGVYCNNPESAEVWYTSHATKSTAEDALEAARVDASDDERNLQNPPSGVSKKQYAIGSFAPLAFDIQTHIWTSEPSAGDKAKWYCAMARINRSVLTGVTRSNFSWADTDTEVHDIFGQLTSEVAGPATAGHRGLFTDVHCIKWRDGVCPSASSLASNETDCIKEHV